MTVDHHRNILDITDRRCRFCSYWRNETNNTGKKGGNDRRDKGVLCKREGDEHTCVKTDVCAEKIGPSALTDSSPESIMFDTNNPYTGYSLTKFDVE